MQSTESDRELFRREVRRALERLSPESAVRELIDSPTGHDPALWERLSVELGLPGLAVPEQFGGQGVGFADLAVAVEESARALLCSPFPSTALATLALLRCPPSAGRDELLTGIAAGQTVVVMATGGSVTLSGSQLSATGLRAVDGQLADRFLISACTPDGRSLFVVDARDAGLTAAPLTVLDLTRRQAELTLEEVPGVSLSGDFAAEGAALLDLAALLASAEIVAVATRALELAVEHVRVRRQFGRPVGSFQAVKHLVADAFAAVEQMRAAIDFAVAAVGSDALTDADRAELTSVVKAYCSEAGPGVVETLIQVLGGTGFTWEHVAHLYLRKAKSLATAHGSARWHREWLAQLLDLTSLIASERVGGPR
ncbi:acyl-CoA dehydrogenase family protein [Pseudonocardia sp. CA-107938]|uniref:acyl-CoA dehydrogenase family protein n=1 Tax=Pseudonocardia sp. CA-107938 TaxID=3240021 RepID=UPI003D9239C8